MTIDKVFVVNPRKKQPSARSYFLFTPEPSLFARLGKATAVECRQRDAWTRLFAQSTNESIWISTERDRTELLLKAAAGYRVTQRSPGRTLGDLLLFQSPKSDSLPALHSVFRRVIGEVDTFKMLPNEELVDVLSAPIEESRDLFVGGSVDPVSESITLARGDLTTIVVPMALFQPSGTDLPDFKKFSVGDYGNTVRFGDYEATADAILYELDPDFRKRLNAKRRNSGKGFGPSLRRLRLQKHLGRGDFSTISAKTIARIERGETGRPHGNTLSVLAKTLGVAADEIETY